MSNNGSVERFVYENVIDNRKGFRQLKQWEQRLNNFNQRQARATQKATVQKTASIKAVQTAEDRARTKAAAKEKAFEKWKLAQFRSTAYGKLTIEQQMNLKRVLSAKSSEEQIRAEYVKTMALMRRENARNVKMAKNKTSVGANAGAGAATGGFVGAASNLMLNPVIASMVVSTVTVGSMIVSGTQQFKDTKTAANLTGMDYNEFAMLANGLMAVSESLNDVNAVGDKIKDLQDRMGEVTKETTYDKKKGEYKGGEGSILANFLLDKGLITTNKSSLDAFMNQSPLKFLESVAKATNGMDVKEQSFILEAFGSDLTNIIRGIQTNPQEFGSAALRAVTFDETQMAAATRFTSELAKLASVFGNMDMTVFQGFTENLSPETLEMFRRIGSVIGDVVDILADAASILLNTVSPFFNLFLSGVNALTSGVKGLIDPLAKIADDLSGLVGKILAPFEQIFDGLKKLVDRLSNWLSQKTDSFLGWFGIGSDDNSSNSIPSNISSTNPLDKKEYSTNYTSTPTPSNNHMPYGAAAQGKVYLENQTNITVELDSDVVARAVTNTEAFRSGVDSRTSGFNYARGY